MEGRSRPYKVVLTGGAWAGKTTLAERMSRPGVRVVPEAALHVIGELTRELGLEEQRRWREEHAVEFQQRIAETQSTWERAAVQPGCLGPPGPQVAGRLAGGGAGLDVVVCDRGLPDGLAYLRHARAQVPQALHVALASASYDLVFVLDTLSDFDPRSRSGRSDDLASSLALRDELLRVYAELGHRTLLVPRLPLQQRLRWIRREWVGLGYPDVL